MGGGCPRFLLSRRVAERSGVGGGSGAGAPGGLTLALGPSVGEEEHEQSDHHENDGGPVPDGNSGCTFYGKRWEMRGLGGGGRHRGGGRGWSLGGAGPARVVARPRGASLPSSEGLTAFVPCGTFWCQHGGGDGVPAPRRGRGGHWPRRQLVHIASGGAGVSCCPRDVVVLHGAFTPWLLFFEVKSWEGGG